jgi:hypothetical protein
VTTSTSSLCKASGCAESKPTFCSSAVRSLLIHCDATWGDTDDRSGGPAGRSGSGGEVLECFTGEYDGKVENEGADVEGYCVCDG